MTAVPTQENKPETEVGGKPEFLYPATISSSPFVFTLHGKNSSALRDLTPGVMCAT